MEIQSKILSSVLEVDGNEVLQAVNQYTKALTLLDQYDHQSLERLFIRAYLVEMLRIMYSLTTGKRLSVMEL